MLNQWWASRHTWNEYVRQLRRHQVAQALDDLVAVEATGNGMGAVARIAMVFGVSYLDGSLPAEGPYVGLALL